MKPEEQNLAIAKASKWIPLEIGKDCPINDIWYNPDLGRKWKNINLGTIHKGIKDYANDLNAMHEAERCLPDDKLDYRKEGNYWSILAEVTGAVDAECIDKAIQRAAHATSAQRAEAFLRTFNLWKQ